MKYMNKAGDVVKELEYLKNSEKIKKFLRNSSRLIKVNMDMGICFGVYLFHRFEISKRYFRDISFDEIKILINHRIHE